MPPGLHHLEFSPIVHLDVDAFFASIEQRDDPKLKGIPVAVGTGVVASCSYEAKRDGIKTGMRLSQARQLCKSLRVVPGDHRRYEIAGRQILGICKEHSSAVEMASLDDLYMQLAQTGPAERQQIATALREQIFQEVGLKVSMGMGNNKMIANVATHHAKELRISSQRKTSSRWIPGTSILAETKHFSPVVAVLPGHEKNYISPWPVEILPTVGSVGKEKFMRLNVTRVAEVAALPLEVLCAMFQKRGPILRNYSLGNDSRPLLTSRNPDSISRCTSFNPPTADQAFLDAMLAHLLERAISWMRFNKLATRCLKIHLRYGDLKDAHNHLNFKTACDSDTLLHQAAKEKLISLFTRRLPLRLLGVELAQLEPASASNLLFTDPEKERADRLAKCKEDIRSRFGFMAVTLGSSLVLAKDLGHDRDNFKLRTPCLTR
ncbi:MAG: DNA polymerase IV [Planctomycetota bacterium]|nr:MAG: DNA polymerase IV [Planctomycetota bacterium]